MGVKLSTAGDDARSIRQNADINVTPFVDIMLVLLIIFMVAAPLATVSIRLDIPPPLPGTPIQAPRDPVYVSIQDSGQLYLADKPTHLETLAADVCAALGGQADCTDEMVFVRAEPDVPYNALMEVMNTFQASGFLRVGLLNEDIT